MNRLEDNIRIRLVTTGDNTPIAYFMYRIDAEILRDTNWPSAKIQIKHYIEDEWIDL